MRAMPLTSCLLEGIEVVLGLFYVARCHTSMPVGQPEYLVSEARAPSSASLSSELEESVKPNRAERPAGHGQWMGLIPSLLVLSGLVAYSILRTAYGRFYAKFGLTPDDVGLDYGQTLARATGLVLTWLLLPGVVLAGSVTVIAVLILGQSKLLERSFTGSRLLSWMPQVSVRQAFRLGLMATIVTVFLSRLLSAYTMPLQAASYASSVHDGTATSPEPIGPFVQFEVRADQAKAYLKGSLAEGLNVPRNVTFLGQHDGTVILWDARNRAVYRIPAGDVVLIIGNCPDAAEIGVGTICRE
jgi:hypothetical protein